MAACMKMNFAGTNNQDKRAHYLLVCAIVFYTCTPFAVFKTNKLAWFKFYLFDLLFPLEK